MEQAKLDTLLATATPAELRTVFLSEHRSRFNPIDFLNYDPHTHRIIRDRIWRPDKIVYREVPNQYDNLGQPLKDYRLVPVSRIAIPWQREIVDTVVSFSVGGKITLCAQPTNDDETAFQQSVIEMWRNNKMQFRVKDIARRMFSETECALIMYSDKDDYGDPTLKINLISPATGDILYPVFDGTGNLIAFGWEYINSNFKLCFDIYTKDTLYKHTDTGTLTLQKTIKLSYGKIPVVYFNQYESEWRKVQHLIERFEISLSNLCDTNDYNGSPIIFASGEINGFAEKGETGKLITGNNGADMKYLSWDSAPESIKLEFDTLKALIYTKTSTVDLSPDALKGMGTAPSGVAFDRMLIAPHMKGQDKQDSSLGEGIQRVVNLFKAGIVNIIEPNYDKVKKLWIEADFSLFRIDDLNDRIQTMAIAMPGKQLVSLKTAVGYIAAAQNVDEEVEDITEEQEQALNAFQTPVTEKEQYA